MSALVTIDLDPPRPPRGHYLDRDEQQRIWDQVVIPLDPDGCWRWVGLTDSLSGEPIVFLRNKQRQVAHVIWADTGHEPVPPRKRLVRTCGPNKWCVNPAHRTRQGPAAREVHTADITLPGKPRPKVIPAEVARLPVPVELTAPAESIELALDVEHAMREQPETEPTLVIRDGYTHNIDRAPALALLDKPGIHVLFIDNSRGVSIYYAPDKECQGHGRDWRGALDNSRKLYDAKAAERKVGAA